MTVLILTPQLIRETMLGILDPQKRLRIFIDAAVSTLYSCALALSNMKRLWRLVRDSIVVESGLKTKNPKTVIYLDWDWCTLS